jgi:hypothetical protein
MDRTRILLDTMGGFIKSLCNPVNHYYHEKKEQHCDLLYVWTNSTHNTMPHRLGHNKTSKWSQLEVDTKILDEIINTSTISINICWILLGARKKCNIVDSVVTLPVHWIPLWRIISWHQIIWVQLTSLAIRHFINQPTTCITLLLAYTANN